MNKGISISVTDKRNKNEDGEFISESFYSEGGLSEFVSFLDSAREQLLSSVMYMEGEKMIFQLKLHYLIIQDFQKIFIRMLII